LDRNSPLLQVLTYYVFAVEYGEGAPAEVDSLWMSFAEAQKRANELDSEDWHVTKWILNSKWEPEEALDYEADL
jgi:hypothetical protein